MNERRGARDYFPLIYNVLKGIVGVDVRRTPASLSRTGLGSWGSLLRGGRGGARLDHPHPGMEPEVVWGALRHLGGFLHVPGLAQFRILRLALGVRLGPALFLSQPWGTARTLQAWGTIPSVTGEMHERVIVGRCGFLSLGIQHLTWGESDRG